MSNHFDEKLMEITLGYLRQANEEYWNRARRAMPAVPVKGKEPNMPVFDDATGYVPEDLDPPEPKVERRGFASMSPEKQREIARRGGIAAHAKGTGHEWTKEEAREAGKKGGRVSRGGRGRDWKPGDPIPRQKNKGLLPPAPKPAHAPGEE